METVHYQERLKDFPLINKKKSTVDEKRSDPEKGLYFFMSDQKERYKLRTGSKKLAPYWYHWIRNHPARISSVKIRKGYDFVTKDDDVVPEGIAINADGLYQYGDLVLMRCDLEGYLQRRLRSRKRSEANLRAVVAKFKKQTQQSGAELDKKLLDEIAGSLTELF